MKQREGKEGRRTRRNRGSAFLFTASRSRGARTGEPIVSIDVGVSVVLVEDLDLDLEAAAVGENTMSSKR
jgi:hypothetical protein